MNIQPITTKRIYQEIIGKFVEFIANDEIQVGDKLPSERELCERFQVSRPSVREALRVMQTIGLVDIRAGGGAYLTEFDLGPFLSLLTPLFLKRNNFGLELLEVRQILELRAAELAAEQTGKPGLQKLEDILANMNAADREDYEEGVRWDVAFHKALFDCTDNIVLIKGSELVNSLIEISINDARKLVLEHAETPDQLYEEHRTILAAIQERDPEKAAAAMKKHLATVKSAYEEYYREG